MSEFDDIVPTISRNSAQSAQSRTVSERRSTLYMIPKEEQQLMHLFSQSSDLIPQMGGDLQPTTPVDEVLEAARAAAEAAAEEAANTDDELRFGAVYGRGSYSVQNQLISASKFAYNAHNESIFDDENLFPTVHHNAPIVKFDEANPDIINHATLKALIVQQTSPEIIDYNLICDFFLTYRTFVSSIEVMELLLTRIMWSLQYIASQQEENITIGKLVLLRTFVALRHWILNYFIDDFVNVTTNSPSLICDIFVNFINQITHESEFVTESMIFENKIFTDLKIHWLTQLNEFWDTKIDIDVIGKKNILMYQLPIVSTIIPRATSMKRGGSSTGNSGIYKLLKSNTDMSIHTNPSFRRSAMLSLYDQKAHHKCLIYEDGAINDENPQMSINNLLLHHKSSRQSINNQLYLLRKPNNSNNCNNTPGNNSGIVSNCTSNSNSIHNNLNFLSNNTNNNNNNSNTTTTNNNNTNNNNNNNPKKRKPLTLVSHKHNHINLQDSSVGLKKTTKNTEIKEYSDKIDNNDDKENNEIDGDSAKVLNNNFPVGGGIVGFSTNGSCKLPTARVENILPNTPVKKMDYFVKSDQVDDLKPPVPFIDNDIGRKTSIKKFVDNWKKSFHVPEGSGNAREIAAAAAGEAESEGMISDSVESTNAASMPIANSRAIIGSRVDILSARIIDELEYLIRYYIQQEPTPNTIPEDNHDELENEQSIDIMSGSPHKKQLKQPILKDPLQASLAQSHRSQQVHVFNDSNEELPEHDIDISDLMIQNNSDLTEAPDLSESFQRPASINWNESLENSQEVKDDEESIDIDDELVFDTTKEEREAKSGTQYFDVSSEFQVEGEGHRDIDDVDVDVDAESNFVSLRDSDNSFQSTISTPSNITQYDEDVTDLGIVLSPQLAPIQQRVQHKPHKLLMAHLGPLHHKRISFNEANINYNQKRLSIISRTSSSSIFKRDSVKSYISYDLIFSSSNGSVKKSVGDDEGGFLRKKTGYNNLRIAGIGATGITHSSHIFDNRQSFASCTSSVRKSIRFSTLFALTELPFNNLDDSKEDIRLKTAIVNGASGSKSGSGAVRTLKLLDVADSSIFSVAIKCKSAKVASGGSSERNSVAIPGISNYVLKELAAIPDESFRSSNDPVEMALSKLEGKEKQNKKQLEDVSFDNTQDILNEINNANTKDVIELDDEFGFNQEEPLTPKKMSIGSLGITSTPNHTEMIEDSMIGNEEEQKEEYEDGAEDEEEDEEEEEQEREGEGEGEGEEQHDEEQGEWSQQRGFGVINSHAKLSQKALNGFLSPKAILDVYTMSNDVLSIEKVMSTNSHVSFILSYDSKSIAEHFTTIEQDILQEIDWKELIELKWNKDLQPVNSWLEIIVNDNYYNQNKGVNLVISRFNLMVNWIISEILLTKAQSERIHIISRFIHIAQNCFVLQNFSSLMQIILALTSEKVSKLKETWKNLPPGDILMLKNLEELASPLKNFLNIRLCINQMTPSKGCIPFVGLYLSDLIFNAERPAFITPPTQDTSNLAERNCFGENEKFINFSRFRTSVHIVKSLSQCIEWSNYYKLPIKKDLLSRCLYVKSLDESEMNYCLNEILNSLDE